MMLVHLFSTVLSVTLLICLFRFSQQCYIEFCENIHLERWMFSVAITLCVTGWGIRRRSLDWSGAVGAVFVGFILTFSSYCFMACLLTFFYTSSKATHYCSEKKKKLEADYKEGGQRNWIQVICNGGAATEIAMLYLLQSGFGETAIEFEKDYERSWLAASVLSSLAGVNGDTWASEIGTVVAKMEPRLITSFQKVPVGTNGGFTAAGLFFSALGGSIVGLAYLLALVLCYRNVVLHQVLLLTCMGAFAGLFGSIIDSVIGATLQYSGLDMRTGKIVENPAVGVKHISGRPLLNNHSVNMIMSIINSIVVPTITARLYLFFM